MMSNYVVCDEPEHDKFGHRKADCRECNPIETMVVVETANPRIGLGTFDKKVLTGLGRDRLISIIEDIITQGNKLAASVEVLIKENEKLKSRNTELAGGLNIKGWWCICEIFNGCEKEERTDCRSCGRPKTVRM